MGGLDSGGSRSIRVRTADRRAGPLHEEPARFLYPLETVRDGETSAVIYSETLQYWDVGVGIEADGNGGVDFVGVSVHYLTPDGPTLLERKAYTSELLKASYLKRTDPEEYEGLLDEGYIHGIREERPAVISVNTLAASLAVNDFLARIHGFRWFSNADCGTGRFNLSDAYFRYEPAPNVKSSMVAYVGRGDTVPPLGEMYVVQ